MKTATLTALRAILESDPPRSEKDRTELLATLGVETGAAPADRLLTFAQAAERLGRGVRIIHTLAARGVLKKFCLPGGQRCAGVRASDIDALLSSGGAA
jgi:hypothetical protein